MKKLLSIVFVLFFCLSCASKIKKIANQFNEKNDYSSLQQFVELLPLESDTTILVDLLGMPTVKTSFDYRYIIDSVSDNRCPIGGVFHFNNKGKIDQKWVGEICE